MTNFFKNISKLATSDSYDVKEFHGAIVLGYPIDEDHVFINGETIRFSNPYYSRLYNKIAFGYFEAIELINIFTNDIDWINSRTLSYELAMLMSKITPSTIVNEFKSKGVIMEKCAVTTCPDARKENLYHTLDCVSIHAISPNEEKCELAKCSDTAEAVYSTILELEKEGSVITTKKISEKGPCSSKKMICEGLLELYKSKAIYFDNLSQI